VGKLVRDRIPEIIEADGRMPVRRTLTEREYDLALVAKLQEEVTELVGARPADRLEEAADVYEVLLAIIAQAGHTREDLVGVAERKRDKRGGVSGRVWLESW